MAEPILIELEIVEPIELELSIEPTYYIGTAQVGPRGEQGLPGESSFWAEDTATTIKPNNDKTVDGDYISGTIYGGLFQP